MSSHSKPQALNELFADFYWHKSLSIWLCSDYLFCLAFKEYQTQGWTYDNHLLSYFLPLWLQIMLNQIFEYTFSLWHIDPKKIFDLEFYSYLSVKLCIISIQVIFFLERRQLTVLLYVKVLALKLTHLIPISQ